MSTFKTGCLICGKPLQYFDSAKTLKCGVCGKLCEADAACEDGHYICNVCHSKKGIETITTIALETKSSNPIQIASEMMKDGFIHMHGPEHHYMVAAALLCAYKNAGGGIELKQSMTKALARARNVPGGVCGQWGCCGAGIGSGIFVSIITGATPLSEKEWSLANEMTSSALAVISKNGGPRCCKRNTYLAIIQAVEFADERLGVKMELSKDVKCEFRHLNKQCRGGACLFWVGNSL